MKKYQMKYEEPEVTVILAEDEEVITSSPGEGDDFVITEDDDPNDGGIWSGFF